MVATESIHMKKLQRRLLSLNLQLEQAELAKDFKRVRSIKKKKLRLELMTCSDAWYAQICASGDQYPIPGMVLCQAEVRIADTANKGRRWTPKDCADWEDASDLGHKIRYPSSVGTVVSMAQLRRGYRHDMEVD